MMPGGADRAEHLTTMLQLRPDQQDALKAFLDATGRTGAGMKRVEHGAEVRTTPERLARMEAHLAQQQTTMKARIEATRTFYAKLDEKQRKVFDTMPMLMMAGHPGSSLAGRRRPAAGVGSEASHLNRWLAGRARELYPRHHDLGAGLPIQS